jgi:hypothetical protein
MCPDCLLPLQPSFILFCSGMLYLLFLFRVRPSIRQEKGERCSVAKQPWRGGAAPQVSGECMCGRDTRQDGHESACERYNQTVEQTSLEIWIAECS